MDTTFKLVAKVFAIALVLLLSSPLPLPCAAELVRGETEGVACTAAALLETCTKHGIGLHSAPCRSDAYVVCSSASAGELVPCPDGAARHARCSSMPRTIFKIHRLH